MQNNVEISVFDIKPLMKRGTTMTLLVNFFYIKRKLPPTT